MRAGLRQHVFSKSWAWPKYYFLHPFFDLVSVSHIHDGSPMQFTCLHLCKSCHHSLEVTLFDTFGLLFMYRWVNPSPPQKYSFFAANVPILTFSSGFFFFLIRHILNDEMELLHLNKNFTLTNTNTIFFNSVPLNFISSIGLKP